MMQLIAFFITYEKLRDYIYYYFETGQFPDSLKLTSITTFHKKMSLKIKKIVGLSVQCLYYGR